MPFDGSGHFNSVMNWPSDALAGVKIKADQTARTSPLVLPTRASMWGPTKPPPPPLSTNPPGRVPTGIRSLRRRQPVFPASDGVDPSGRDVRIEVGFCGMSVMK